MKHSIFTAFLSILILSTFIQCKDDDSKAEDFEIRRAVRLSNWECGTSFSDPSEAFTLNIDALDVGFALTSNASITDSYQIIINHPESDDELEALYSDFDGVDCYEGFDYYRQFGLNGKDYSIGTNTMIVEIADNANNTINSKRITINVTDNSLADVPSIPIDLNTLDASSCAVVILNLLEGNEDKSCNGFFSLDPNSAYAVIHQTDSGVHLSDYHYFELGYVDNSVRTDLYNLENNVSSFNELEATSHLMALKSSASVVSSSISIDGNDQLIYFEAKTSSVPFDSQATSNRKRVGIMSLSLENEIITLKFKLSDLVNYRDF